MRARTLPTFLERVVGTQKPEDGPEGHGRYLEYPLSWRRGIDPARPLPGWLWPEDGPEVPGNKNEPISSASASPHLITPFGGPSLDERRSPSPTPPAGGGPLTLWRLHIRSNPTPAPFLLRFAQLDFDHRALA
jgi:hypothetical protein